MYMSAGHQILTVIDSHGPLIPHLRLRIISPNLYSHLLSFWHHQRCLDWEIHREPTVHSWCVLLRLDAVEDFLVQLCSEVPSKSMQFRLCLLHDEALTIIHSKVLITSLRQFLKFFLVRVRQVSESKHVLWVITTRICCAVNLHDIRQLKRVQLLL